jgi:hypothetical protein
MVTVASFEMGLIVTDGSRLHVPLSALYLKVSVPSQFLLGMQVNGRQR